MALARPNCEDTKNTNLYIRNIPLSFDEQLLHDLFSQYGEVVQVRLLRDQNTAFSRRIGFIIMATKQMAQTAIQHLDNTIPPNGGSEPIYVKYADEEGKKRHGPGGNTGGNMRMNNSTIMNQQQHHQNSYQNSSNNYLSPQSAHGFNFNNPNSFIMPNNNQNGLNPLLANSLQNLGKMKTNRSSGHQNRYNPIGGTAAATLGGMNNQGMSNAGLSANTGGAPGNNYNPWNMNMAAAATVIQQPYSNFNSSNQSNIVGNSLGINNLLNTVGTGRSNSGTSLGAETGGGGSLFNGFNQQNNTNPHQLQHFTSSSNPNNFLNLNSAQAVVIRNDSTNNDNLLDVGNIGIGTGNLGMPMDTNKSSNLASMVGNLGNNGHIIYVYGIGQANESDLYSLFSNCGRILRVNVIKNQKTGQCN